MAEMMKVARGLELPHEYVTQTGGLLAVRGAGKSNAARVMAEEMFHAGLPFCAIDPVGSWYGLRSGRDGTPNGGLPVFIFGGAHGDVPLNRDAGALAADVVVDQRLTCIVDLSGFEDDADKRRFLLAFSKRLYFRNKDPLHLFLEEADDYIPQDMSDVDRALVKAWENIVRRGRSRGIGCTIITQRSAAINKKVFTQVENLFVLRTTGPQDIKAIAEWVKYHKVKEELLDSLAALEDGEAWVWSPHFLKQTKKFRFRVSATFDSGATPKNFKGRTARKVATLRDVDVKQLRDRIADTREKVEAEDPVLLRQRVSKLKAELHSQQKKIEHLESKVASGASSFAQIDRKLVQSLLREVSGCATAVHSLEAELARKIAVAEKPLSNLTALLAAMETQLKGKSTADTSTFGVHPIESVHTPRAADRTVTAQVRAGTAASGSKNLQACPRALLAALAMMHPKSITDSSLSILSGYSLKSSGFVNGLSTLRTAGFMGGERSALFATDAGLKENGEVVHMGTGMERVEFWKGKLDKTPRDLLQALADKYPATLTREELATDAGKSLTSSGFVNGLSTLKTLTLMVVPSKNTYQLNPEFFDAG